jgi:hypothetical protein
MMIDDMDLKELENVFDKALSANLLVEETVGDDDSTTTSGSYHNHTHAGHNHHHNSF